ncbi:GNAT family N-acetyltransferase [Micromonospora halophytica]|uniref:Ribosomal protein S18 acetylase RimI n=1 Tax=Micromonospora halophytica TaxID=47864 RepID=A0A1C5IRB6_9ACTN|nr:GNAT family N-acetyltransferase [Micromonospora halophytica]SCG60541.1 Ribosomal protein S18 acetylase RimI [Micromonospora halophytica]
MTDHPPSIVTVRALTAADWPALWPMLRDMGVNDQPPEAQRDRYLLLLADPRWAILGAEADGELLGYAAAQDHGPHLRAGDDHRTARLHDLYVSPHRRRGGVGRTLLAAVRDWATGRVRHLEWQAHHERAAPFYECLGHHGDPCPQPDYPTFHLDLRP